MKVVKRFLDQRQSLYDFADEFLVLCPRCRGCATVKPKAIPDGIPSRGLRWEQRLLCSGCGYSRDHLFQDYMPRLGVDPWFQLPLWLRTTCAGGELWAYNWRHLDFVERYVSAYLREQRRDPQRGWSNQSAANRLPEWIKAAKNRDDVLHGIARLKKKL